MFGACLRPRGVPIASAIHVGFLEHLDRVSTAFAAKELGGADTCGKIHLGGNPNPHRNAVCLTQAPAIYIYIIIYIHALDRPQVWVRSPYECSSQGWKARRHMAEVNVSVLWNKTPFR